MFGGIGPVLRLTNSQSFAARLEVEGKAVCRLQRMFGGDRLMVAYAVTRAWQKSLEAPPPDDRNEQLALDSEGPMPTTHGWHRREATKVVDQAVAGSETKADTEDDDHPISFGKGDNIVPRRAAVSSVEPPADSLMASREFWMGIVFGAGIVLVIKTVLAVQAPFGIHWY